MLEHLFDRIMVCDLDRRRKLRRETLVEITLDAVGDDLPKVGLGSRVDGRVDVFEDQRLRRRLEVEAIYRTEAGPERGKAIVRFQLCAEAGRGLRACGQLRLLRRPATRKRRRFAMHQTSRK